jgi:hypothetical protein
LESEVVWGLSGKHGFAECDSNDSDRPVLIFWSDRGYASRVRQQSYPDYKPSEISLFDFLFRWLPGMEGDKVLVGTNWTGDLVGLEFEPRSLQEEMISEMAPARWQAYKTQLASELTQQRQHKDTP